MLLCGTSGFPPDFLWLFSVNKKNWIGCSVMWQTWTWRLAQGVFRKWNHETMFKSNFCGELIVCGFKRQISQMFMNVYVKFCADPRLPRVVLTFWGKNRLKWRKQRKRFWIRIIGNVLLYRNILFSVYVKFRQIVCCACFTSKKMAKVHVCLRLGLR